MGEARRQASLLGDTILRAAWEINVSRRFASDDEAFRALRDHVAANAPAGQQHLAADRVVRTGGHPRMLVQPGAIAQRIA